MRIAQVEAAWEFVAKGLVREIRTECLRAADNLSGLSPQQTAASIASVAKSVVDRRWPDVLRSLLEMSSRAAGLATVLLNGAIQKQSEAVQDDLQAADKKAEDQFGQKIEELQQTALLLFLVSQFQVYAHLREIQIQGLSLETWYQDIGNGVYRRIFTSTASSLANGDSPRTSVDLLTRDRGGFGQQSILPLVRGNLSTMVHGVGTGMMQYVSLANQSLFYGEVHSAIIDDVTCRICRDLNGTFYPFENGESTARSVPVHRSCRCNLVPVIASRESEGSEAPRDFDSWLRDNVDMQQELLGSRAKSFADGEIHIGSFIDYRRMFQIPAQTFPELQSLIWQVSQ